MLLLIIVVAGFVIYFFIRRKSLLKQVEMFNKLLYVEKNPAAYVAEVDKILRRAVADKEKNINRIQKTTGLLFMGEFEQVIKILSDDVNKIPPYWQHVYYHNMILSMFLSGDKEKGNKTLSEAKEVLDQYAKRSENEAAIEFVYAVADYYNSDGAKRKEFFETLTSGGRNDYRIAFGYYFLGKINEETGNTEEAKSNLSEAARYGQGSFVEKLCS